jgi:hypothetical protein
MRRARSRVVANRLSGERSVQARASKTIVVVRDMRAGERAKERAVCSMAGRSRSKGSR